MLDGWCYYEWVYKYCLVGGGCCWVMYVGAMLDCSSLITLYPSILLCLKIFVRGWFYSDLICLLSIKRTFSTSIHLIFTFIINLSWGISGNVSILLKTRKIGKKNLQLCSDTAVKMGIMLQMLYRTSISSLTSVT